MLSNRLDWNRVERLVSAKVDQSHQKSICKKIFRKYSARGHERGLQILSKRMTRHS